jgi:hypothetical protein
MILAREQLYQRVWETPIDTLRKEFGISNVGLGKICRHRQIPVPPRGYWAKKYAGHKMKLPPPLPDPTKFECRSDHFPLKEPVVKSEAVAGSVAVPPEIAFERDPAGAIMFPTISGPHTRPCQQPDYWSL